MTSIHWNPTYCVFTWKLKIDIYTKKRVYAFISSSDNYYLTPLEILDVKRAFHLCFGMRVVWVGKPCGIQTTMNHLTCDYVDRKDFRTMAFANETWLEPNDTHGKGKGTSYEKGWEHGVPWSNVCESVNPKFKSNGMKWEISYCVHKPCKNKNKLEFPMQGRWIYIISMKYDIVSSVSFPFMFGVYSKNLILEPLFFQVSFSSGTRGVRWCIVYITI